MDDVTPWPCCGQKIYHAQHCAENPSRRRMTVELDRSTCEARHPDNANLCVRHVGGFHVDSDGRVWWTP